MTGKGTNILFLLGIIALDICNLGKDKSLAENAVDDLAEDKYDIFIDVPPTPSRVKRQYQGFRPGKATETNSCHIVRCVPTSFRSSEEIKPAGIPEFYQKYTEAYGIPVLSSSEVSDDALRRACYVLRFLLADHSGVRQSFYRWSGRVAVIGKDENSTDLPEFSKLPDWWNQRTRGLGATTHAPVSSGGEENILCYQKGKDKYWNEDIYVHEVAHAIHSLGAVFALPGWEQRLNDHYVEANVSGLWSDTYSLSTSAEYFAEGVQTYFDVNAYSSSPNGIHGPIDTRAKLLTYDPKLYTLIQELFPCNNTYLKRCNSTREQEHEQNLKMNCEAKTNVSSDCVDKNVACADWAFKGECAKNPRYMNVHCQFSCKQCGTASSSTTAPTTSTSNGKTQSLSTSPSSACNGDKASLTTVTVTLKVETTQTATTSTSSQTTGTAGIPTGPDCLDNNSQCPGWAATGECAINPDYMHDNCRLSCKLCRSTVKTTCTDDNKDCSYWAEIGECEKNPVYMLANCKQSCRTC